MPTTPRTSSCVGSQLPLSKTEDLACHGLLMGFGRSGEATATAYQKGLQPASMNCQREMTAAAAGVHEEKKMLKCVVVGDGARQDLPADELRQRRLPEGVMAHCVSLLEVLGWELHPQGYRCGR